jgi:hypothetical protein
VEETFREIGGLPQEVDTIFVRAPFDRGGLGLRGLGVAVSAANIASLLLCLPHLREANPVLEDHINKLNALPLDDVQDKKEAWDLMHLANTEGFPILSVLFAAWAELWTSGYTKTIPSHPYMLLRDFYESEAKKEDALPTFKIQKSICGEIDRRAGNKLHTHAAGLSKAVAARVHSNTNSASTAWLRTLPVKPSLRLDSITFKQAVGIHCSMPPPAVPAGTCCTLSQTCCQVETKLDLPHALSCKGLASRNERHNIIRDDILAWLQMRKLVVKKEYTPWKGNAEDGLFAVDIWVRTEKAQELWCDISIPELVLRILPWARTKEQAEQQQRLSQTSDLNTKQRYRGMEKSACVLCL